MTNLDTYSMMQTTLGGEIHLSGVGVHSGRHVCVSLCPAAADTGILFQRIDIEGEDGFVLAHANNAIETQLCTRIENSAGIAVNMIEHLMAAFHGLGVDNALVKIDGPEVPILDGSSAIIIETITRAGISQLDAPRHYIEILEPVSVALETGATATLTPAGCLQLDVDIDFTDPGIGKQQCEFDITEQNFADEIGLARTFCMLSDVEKMRNAGLAKGGSLDNALVYDNGQIMNEGGLRMTDECVKHKALDCIGDLYLLGMPIKGRLTSHMPGHRLSTLLVRAVLEQPSCYRIVSAQDDLAVAPAVDLAAVPVAATA